MTLTYLDTCQLVQERNGETCELASFAEVSSASLANTQHIAHQAELERECGVLVGKIWWVSMEQWAEGVWDGWVGKR